MAKKNEPTRIIGNAAVNTACSFFSTFSYHLINAGLKRIGISNRVATKMINSGLLSVFRDRIRRMVKRRLG